MVHNKNSNSITDIITSTAVGAVIGATIGGVTLMCRNKTSNCPSCMKHSAHSVLRKAENAMKNLRKSI